MKKYKLIKEYPGSPKLGIIVESPNYYTDDTKTAGRWIPEGYILQFPQYWELVEDKKYEILELVNRYNKDWTCCGTNISSWLKGYGKDSWDISKVKRLSDGLIISLGDKYKEDMTDTIITIDSIEIVANWRDGLRIGNKHSGICLESFIPYVEPQVWITTADGVNIYDKNQEVAWCIKHTGKDYWEYMYMLDTDGNESLLTNAGSIYKAFSTKEAALKFCEESKPKVLFTVELTQTQYDKLLKLL